MSAKTMSEVLAEHVDIAWNHVNGNATCGGCDAYLGPLTADMVKQDRWLIAHQAAALSAAGFGLVADAKGEALEEAAEELTWVRPDSSPCGDTESCCGSAESCDAMRPSVFVASPAWLRARAAAVRGEG